MRKFLFLGTAIFTYLSIFQCWEKIYKNNFLTLLHIDLTVFFPFVPKECPSPHPLFSHRSGMIWPGKLFLSLALQPGLL
jgi:hypothetical protein